MKREELYSGIILIHVLLICTVAMILATSLGILLKADHKADQSKIDTEKAYYLAEIAAETVVENISASIEQIIEEYLFDLREYKIYYITKYGNIDLNNIRYEPPSFEQYLHTKFISQIGTFNFYLENPFREYDHFHFYQTEVSYDPIKETVSINTSGGYNRARKFLKIELLIPKLFNDGKDNYGLDKIKIKSVVAIGKYQIFGQ